MEEDPGGKLLPAHSAIASDSRGFLREPRARRLPLAAFGILPSLRLRSTVVGDAEETAGVPVKGKPERREPLAERLRDGRRGEIAPIRRAFSRDNSVDNRESYESPDS